MEIAMWQLSVLFTSFWVSSDFISFRMLDSSVLVTVKMIIKERRGGRSFYVFYMNPADLLWYHRRWQAQTEDNKMKFAKSVSDGLHWYVKDGDMVKICMLISVCKIILVGWHVSAL
ncbi:hypothetical protein EV1_019061 [Malus domestica]